MVYPPLILIFQMLDWFVDEETIQQKGYRNIDLSQICADWGREVTQRRKDATENPQGTGFNSTTHTKVTKIG